MAGVTLAKYSQVAFFLGPFGSCFHGTLFFMGHWVGVGRKGREGV
jgi:hypothetical protein